MMKESLYGEKERVRLLAEILKKMDNPVNDVKVIHVSGTNGKGSTCYMINSILLNSARTLATLVVRWIARKF